MRVLRLREHTSSYHGHDVLTYAEGELLHGVYGQQIDVVFPSPATRGMWKITPLGWAGVFPLTSDLTVVSQPKVPIGNLARMLSYAYDLPIRDYPGIVSSATLIDFFDQLAAILVNKSLKLLRQGVHHAYRTKGEIRTSLRGRIDIPKSIMPRSDGRLACVFEERTADLVENKAIAWTLYLLLRSNLCQPETRAGVREAFRQFGGFVMLEEIDSEKLRRIRYDRLTERYREAHAICSLILDARAPDAASGIHAILPFMLKMPALFEKFVFRWLEQHLRPRTGGAYWIKEQEYVRIGSSDKIGFFIDIVVYDAGGSPVCVLDTKYKDSQAPATDDVAQIGYYALIMGCNTAGLIYPVGATREWDGMSGEVYTFRDTFGLQGDLEKAGDTLLESLLGRLSPARLPAARTNL